MQLLHLLHRQRTLAIEIVGQVLQVYALGAFLALLKPKQWKRDLASCDLSDKLFGREMAEVVAANDVDGNYGLPIILSHK